MFSEYTGMTVNVQKCCITCALLSKGNALSPPKRSHLAPRIQDQHVSVNGSNSPIPSIGPSDTYRILGLSLNTTLTFTNHWHELKRTTATLINAFSTALLTYPVPESPSHPRPPHRQALYPPIDLVSDSQLDTLDGQICRTLCSVVSSVRNLPRTALHRPTRPPPT
jgi:hypothetical protein